MISGACMKDVLFDLWKRCPHGEHQLDRFLDDTFHQAAIYSTIVMPCGIKNHIWLKISLRMGAIAVSGKILCLSVTHFCVACHSATVGEIDTKPVLYNMQHL